MHQRGDQPHLLPVPRGQLPDALVKVRVESLPQLVDVILVDAATQPGEKPQRLRTGHRGVQGQVAGQVAEPAMDLDGVAAGIEAKQPGGATGGADLVEEDADGGGLARAVGAEETKDLPGADLQVNALQCFEGAVLLPEFLHLDGVHCSFSFLSRDSSSWGCICSSRCGVNRLANNVSCTCT